MSFGRNPRGEDRMPSGATISCHIRIRSNLAGRPAALLRHIGQKVGSPCLLILDHASRLRWPQQKDMASQSTRFLLRAGLEYRFEPAQYKIRQLPQTPCCLYSHYVANARVKGLILQLTSCIMHAWCKDWVWGNIMSCINFSRCNTWSYYGAPSLRNLIASLVCCREHIGT
jgi:hypothetical protein